METDYTELHVLRAYTSLCMQLSQTIIDQGNERDNFDLSLMDTFWQVGSVARELGLQID